MGATATCLTDMPRLARGRGSARGSARLPTPERRPQRLLPKVERARREVVEEEEEVAAVASEGPPPTPPRALISLTTASISLAPPPPRTPTSAAAVPPRAPPPPPSPPPPPPPPRSRTSRSPSSSRDLSESGKSSAASDAGDGTGELSVGTCATPSWLCSDPRRTS